jgi:TPP-dependent pyruvate/acetoin dehydrogenase alpha subunit
MCNIIDRSPNPDAIVTASPIEASDAHEILQLRYWQHLLNEMLKEKNKFKIPVHLAFGHEAVAVAVDRCMGPHDVMCASHRNAVYNLIRARSFATVLAHYQLLSRGSTDSLMGSMNLAVPETGISYTSSILGNNLPVAAGIAMNQALAKKPGVVFVSTGDGAMEEGSFWETMVFARSHRLPLVIIVENNNHSMSSTIAERRSEIGLAKVCDGIGIRYFSAAGAIIGDTKHAIALARVAAASGNPSCVELQISTFNQHAGPSPGWPEDPRNIALKNGLIVADSLDDPVCHVKNTIGEAEYNRLVLLVLESDVSANDVH